MTENNTVRRRGIKLKTPEDARRLIRRIVDKAFATDQELEYSGRLSQLLTCWLKAWELQRSDELDARISKLEAQLERKT